MSFPLLLVLVLTISVLRRRNKILWEKQSKTVLFFLCYFLYTQLGLTRFIAAGGHFAILLQLCQKRLFSQWSVWGVCVCVCVCVCVGWRAQPWGASQPPYPGERNHSASQILNTQHFLLASGWTPWGEKEDISKCRPILMGQMAVPSYIRVSFHSRVLRSWVKGLHLGAGRRATP